MRRPSPEIETAGGRSSLSFIGGDRGPYCLLQYSCKVFVVKSKDLSVISSSHEVLTVIVPVPLIY
jgi:hypothetical protein